MAPSVRGRRATSRVPADLRPRASATVLHRDRAPSSMGEVRPFVARPPGVHRVRARRQKLEAAARSSRRPRPNSSKPVPDRSDRRIDPFGVDGRAPLAPSAGSLRSSTEPDSRGISRTAPAPDPAEPRRSECQIGRLATGRRRRWRLHCGLVPVHRRGLRSAGRRVVRPLQLADRVPKERSPRLLDTVNAFHEYIYGRNQP